MNVPVRGLRGRCGQPRTATAAFFSDQQRWVTDAFRAAGLATDRAGRAASAYLAALEGALLLARVVRASRAPTAAAPPDARPTQPSAATVVADSAAGLASAATGVCDIAATLLDACSDLPRPARTRLAHCHPSNQ